MSNVKTPIKENLSFCDACQYGKSHALPFTKSTSRATTILDLVHTDLWRPAPIASHTNFKYYIQFLEDFSRYTWLYPLKNKIDALEAFTRFKTMAKTQFDRKIKRLRTDWRGEFQAFSNLVHHNGIIFKHSYLHTSEQNRRAERKHRHIVEMGPTLLAQAVMPLKY